MFRVNTAKTSVFDVLSWWLYLRHSVCFPFTEPGLCLNTGLFRVFSAHIQNRKLVDGEEIFSEFDKKCIGLESYTTHLMFLVAVFVCVFVINSSALFYCYPYSVAVAQPTINRILIRNKPAVHV